MKNKLTLLTLVMLITLIVFSVASFAEEPKNVTGPFGGNPQFLKQGMNLPPLYQTPR